MINTFKSSRTVVLFLIFSLALVSCSLVSIVPEPAVTKHTYTPFSGPILNPERGFFTPYDLPGPVGFSPIRLTGSTLVHLVIRLDGWRETDIPQEILDGLQINFDDLRLAGIKAILRFAYNQGPFPDTEPDASKAQILHHIEQLQPLLQKNSDVIAWIEAGFIGAWGEWHSSTNGLDNLQDKRAVLTALLAAMPENRVVQVRYPANIIDIYPKPADAAAARVGHHNDCFLSSDTDVGTYERDGKNTIVRDQAYLAELTRLTPMSGETCAPNPPRSDCDSAIQEMELLHFSAINEAFHKGIIRSWKKDGCLDEIDNRLGYRLSLVETTYNEQVRPGGLLNLTVDLENGGFAAPVNPRPVFLILRSSPGAGSGGEQKVHKIQLDIKPITWQPGAASFTARLRLPSTLPEGPYTLALWLPDEAETLRDNPLYAIRLANEDTWEEDTGYNILGTLTVDPTVSGSFQEGEEFKVVKLK